MTSSFINVTVPVLNEERVLAASIEKLVNFLESHLPYRFEIIIADNGSIDSTIDIAQELARTYPSVQVLRLDEEGRGGAIRNAWQQSHANILTYMDVDLSTSLTMFPKMVDAIVHQEFDIAIGSRLLVPSLTTRGLKREILSRCYNQLIKLMFRTRFSDAQCGFKAIEGEAARRLLPKIKDRKWFFDTELLINAEQSGFRILDLPVPWVDDPDSRVKIIPTVIEDIKGLFRLKYAYWRER